MTFDLQLFIEEEIKYEQSYFNGKIDKRTRCKYLHQGTKIVVTGRIQTGSYTNKDGQRVYTTDVVVEEQEFAESKSAAAGNGGDSNYAAYTPSRPEPSQAAGDGFMAIPDGVDDEGLPFN